MGTLHKYTTVPAPPDAVYAYVANVRNAPNYITAIRQITSGPTGPPAVGTRFGAAATFLGRPAHLTLRVVSLRPAHEVVLALEGDPAGTLTIRVAPALNGQATRVDTELDVPSVAGILLGAMMGGMLDESMTRLAHTAR